jgi:hypothetical protein
LLPQPLLRGHCHLDSRSRETDSPRREWSGSPTLQIADQMSVFQDQDGGEHVDFYSGGPAHSPRSWSTKAQRYIPLLLPLSSEPFPPYAITREHPITVSSWHGCLGANDHAMAACLPGPRFLAVWRWQMWPGSSSRGLIGGTGRVCAGDPALAIGRDANQPSPSTKTAGLPRTSLAASVSIEIWTHTAPPELHMPCKHELLPSPLFSIFSWHQFQSGGRGYCVPPITCSRSSEARLRTRLHNEVCYRYTPFF